MYNVGSKISYLTRNKKNAWDWQYTDVIQINEQGEAIELKNGMKVKFVKKTSYMWSIYQWVQGTDIVFLENLD